MTATSACATSSALTLDADRPDVDLPDGAAWDELWADARDERAVAVFAQALHERPRARHDVAARRRSSTPTRRRCARACGSNASRSR